LTSAKHDPRLRTVVCRHWLRDLLGLGLGLGLGSGTYRT
jgi:hypothetical protein